MPCTVPIVARWRNGPFNAKSTRRIEATTGKMKAGGAAAWILGSSPSMTKEGPNRTKVAGFEVVESAMVFLAIRVASSSQGMPDMFKLDQNLL